MSITRVGKSREYKRLFELNYNPAGDNPMFRWVFLWAKYQKKSAQDDGFWSLCVQCDAFCNMYMHVCKYVCACLHACRYLCAYVYVCTCL
mmetsp:Transcript_90589/g.146612  ORF Transcript_90589/g.146612 Transcript_90589/m.146612 type:complete len:90 (-) Transcript_90589:1037-1306(-)